MFLYLPKSNFWQSLKTSLWREATIKSIVSVFILSWPKSQFKRFSQNRQKECFLFMSWFSFHRPLLQVSSEVAKASTAKEEEEKILLLVTFPLFCSRIWVDCNLLLDPKVRTSSLWLLALYVRVYNVLLYISPPIFWERGGFPSARSHFYCFYLFFPCLLILSYHHKVNLQRLNCRGVTDVEQTDLQVGAGEIVSPITLDSVRCGFRRFGGIAERSSVLVSAGWNRWKIEAMLIMYQPKGFL